MLDDDGLPLDEVGPWAKEKHERVRKYVDISRAARRKFVQGSGEQQLPALSNIWLGTSVESADYTGRIATLRKVPARVRFVSFEPLLASVGRVNLKDIHWAIVGGESGPSARPMDPDWVSNIQSACEKFGTAFFFKQWGGINKKKTGRLLNGRTWDEYPMMLTAAE